MEDISVNKNVDINYVHYIHIKRDNIHMSTNTIHT